MADIQLDARETAENAKSWSLPTFIAVKSERKDTYLTTGYYRWSYKRGN